VEVRVTYAKKKSAVSQGLCYQKFIKKQPHFLTPPVSDFWFLALDFCALFFDEKCLQKKA